MTVKVFRSTDFGAPANTNAAGALIAILDACLVNGYGSQTVTSITRTGTTATVTTPSAHLLKDGTFMRISGAGQSDYNGDFAITVTGATTFTYQVANSPVTPATGTITSKVAPADWTKPFSGTNLAAYKQGAGSNGMYLRVSDTTTAFARVKAFEAMTDISTGTGDFPTETQFAGGLYAGKSNSTTARVWDIIADEKALHIFIGEDGTQREYYFFGDIISNKSGDAFNTVIDFGGTTGAGGSYQTLALATSLSAGAVTVGHYIARPHTQVGQSLQCAFMSDRNSGQNSLGQQSGAMPYPCPIDNSLHISPILAAEMTAGLRGKVPGLWNPIHNIPFQNGDIITGTGVNSGRKFLAQLMSNQTGTTMQALIEISNTWYS